MARCGTLVKTSLALLVVAFLFPTSVHANTGVPMLFLTWPAMLVSLVPIIVIETYVLFMRLGLSLGTVAKVASVANAASTLIGIPVAWILLVLLQMFTGGGNRFGIETAWKKFLAVTWQAPWLVPYEEEDLRWMVPSAGLALLVPFFFASWLIEYHVARLFFGGLGQQSVKDSLLLANLATYGILAVLGFGFLAISLNLPSRLGAVAKKVWLSLGWGKRLRYKIMDAITPGRGSQTRLVVKSREESLEQGTHLLTGGGDG